ncbi:hypothetical protein JAAARDRAFT_210720 [Jaapia argillacea MUCL 33604]|uniref:Transmembrane protein n=1 Tax=Jaapia argillacea MUCL 33604 TaxID=933084 RepID=A0A067PB60_9AGAM|nr:hypothetical protein JAAARDRAFT_210720 [Jaapia argillacea MUCL 33604]
MTSRISGRDVVECEPAGRSRSTLVDTVKDLKQVNSVLSVEDLPSEQTSTRTENACQNEIVDSIFTAVKCMQAGLPLDSRIVAQSGYKTLGVISTFLAGVQIQVLTALAIDRQDALAQVAGALFFTGFIADVMGAILCFQCARWFELLTPDEITHLRSSWADVEAAHEEVKDSMDLVACWLALSLRASIWVASFGFGCSVVGVMIFIWVEQSVAIRVVSTVCCCCCALFIPPFVIKHDRVRVLKRMRLRRASD